MHRKLSLLALVVAASAGCHKSVQSTETADAAVAPAVSAATVAAVAPDEDADAGTEIAPSAAVVAQDPSIPVNEAVVGTAPMPVTYTAAFAPPAQPVTEEEPTRHETEDVWVPGSWWWSQPLARYGWVGGAWRHPPPEQPWSPGRWTQVGGRYSWTPGYWARHGEVREAIEMAPPPMRVEVRPTAPGADFVWTPGYYAWRGGRYEWSAGNWARPPHPGVTWVEPRYVSSGGRYYLQPGRWDFAPEHRGVVYRPDINARPGVRVRLEPVAPEVVVAHTNFVAVSQRAVLRGGVRTERGGFVVPHAVITEVVRPEERAHLVVEPRRVEVRAPEVREHVEVRGAPEVREHVEVREPRVEQRVEVTPPRVDPRVRVDVRAPVVTPQTNGRVQVGNDRDRERGRRR